MSKSTVIQDIKSKIRPNGEQSITGQVLQDVLVESVNLVPEKVSELVNDSQYQTKANLDTALASKADASSIPTKTSQLANDSGFMTATEVSTTYATKAEVPTKTSQLANDSTYQTKANLDTALATKADKSSLASKQDKLVSGTNIKTVNNQSILGSGNISIESGTSITVDSALSTTSENPVQNKVITNTLQTKANASDIPTKVSQLENDSKFATQTAVATGLATKADKDSLTSLEGSVSTLETTVRNQDKSIIANAQAIQGKQDKLVSGTNIKTVNNQSILGSGNISIEGGGSATVVDDALSDTSENPVQNKVITTKVTTIGEVVTGLDAKVDANKSATDSALIGLEGKVNEKVGSINPGSAINVTGTTTTPTVSVKLAETQGNVQLDVTNGLKANLSADAALSTTSENPVQNKVITTKVNSLETSLGSKANASDIPTKVSQLENDSTYQTKANLDTALEGYATTESVTTEVGKKQDKLVSGTNIKTINSQSLLGEGNISIESTSITVDNALSDTSENPVQNKVVTAELNNKPSYVTKGSKHFLNVEGDLDASGGIYSRGIISAGSSRGTLNLNDRSKYTDNKVDIFRWTGYSGGDTFVLTSDANAGTKSLSLDDGSGNVPIQYTPDTGVGKLVYNCNVVLKGVSDKGYQPEFQILDYAAVLAGSTTPDYVSIKCDDGWFKINWVNGSTNRELVAISPDEFNVFGENIPTRADYNNLATRVTALENSLGDIDTALNTILGNS